MFHIYVMYLKSRAPLLSPNSNVELYACIIKSTAALHHMQRKVDFNFELQKKPSIALVKVGQPVQIQQQQQDGGTWTCSLDDNILLGELPADVSASICSHAAFTAVVRSVKRCPDNAEAVSSIQVRVSFPPAGKAKHLTLSAC